MGLRVRTNMSGIQSSNSLNKTEKSKNKIAKKLASGYKINCAGDDASGLSISEKMRNQITALDTATDNTEDGVNMIQTAEGYITEVQEMVSRMTELSEKAANGVLDDNDREPLQKEMNQLCAEIDRIASSAAFNEHKLLDGSLGGSTPVGIFADQFTQEVTVLGPDNTDFKCGTIVNEEDLIEGLKYTNTSFGTLPMDGNGNAMMTCTASDGNTYTLKVAPKDGDKIFFPANSTTAKSMMGVTVDLPAGVTGDTVCTYDLSIHQWIDQNGQAITINTNTFSGNDGFTYNTGMELQIGESSIEANRLGIKLNSVHSDTLFKGLDGFVNRTIDETWEKSTAVLKVIHPNEESSYNNSYSINIKDRDSASASADALSHMGTYLSNERGRLGAYQNRLDYTVNNLRTTSENTTESMSRIKDTDMAKAMAELTTENVLTQATQTMLSQANSQPKDILSLVQQ